MALLAFAAAVHTAAASERFVPADPHFVVANVGRSMPDDDLRRKISAWQADPNAEATTVPLASAFLARARATREPMFVGRAEAVLAPVVRQSNASAAQRRLYAQTLQYRHDFAGAERLLDDVLVANSRDTSARTLRASVRLVRGDFAGARGDCAQLLAAGEASAAIGVACLAEALAGAGQLVRARALLATFSMTDRLDAAARAYLLTVRAELAERALDLAGAIADYRAALALIPDEDSTRAALADALAASGDEAGARTLLDIDRPSVALLVRAAGLARQPERARLQARASEWIALEASRGDAVHNREAALLALSAGDARAALTAARANFAVQRELADVRVLARAAIAARDARARQTLREWLDSTGFSDALTEKILDGAARG
jgi:1,2-phenylacetyl-CoA epoxidase PaaB subunit